MDERSRDIFFDALDLPASERRDFLDQQTAGDPRLRADLESLLRANSEATDFLSGPPPAVPMELETPAPEVPGYETQHRIGQGGFGTVFLARQAAPLDRPVAIKVLRAERLDDRSIQRFNAEQKILGSLCHPHIAAVHEAGQTEAGCPYTVMEWIDGSPINEWCDRHRAPIDQRLELFLEVCDATAFAHRRAVIHADLKPSNVLVRTEDGKPCTKVIDFGLARTLQQNESRLEGDEADVMSDGTLHSLLGTPSYMSPEQAGPRGTLVDTRADVYGLGAMLYELLVGVPALDIPADSTLCDTLIAVQTTAIVSPSARFASLSPFGRERRSKRTTSSESRLQRRLEGDLDAIVERCLRKDPDDRYATVEQLAEDVRRHLAKKPVLTRQMGWTHSVSRFVQRNLIGVSVAAVLTAGLLGGLGSSLIHLDRARRAETGQAAAQDSARAWNAAAGRTADFLSSLFISPSPSVRGREVRVVDILDLADERLPTTFANDPIVLARLSSMIGAAYHHLGDTEPAIRNLQRAVRLYDQLGERDSWRNAASELMLALGNAERAEEAEVWCDRLEAGSTGDPDFQFCIDAARVQLAVRRDDFGRALEIAESNLELARSAGLGSKREIEATRGLALALRVNGREQEAAELFSNAEIDPTLEIGSLTHGELRTVRELARVLIQRGELRRAADLLNQILDQEIEILGATHIDVTNTRYLLSEVLMKLGGEAAAIQLIADARDAQIARFGSDHPRARSARLNHAVALQNSGDRASARTELLALQADSGSAEITEAERLLLDAMLAVTAPEGTEDPEEPQKLRALLERLDTVEGLRATNRERILNAVALRFGRIGSYGDSAEVFHRLAEDRFQRNGPKDPDWLRQRHAYAKCLLNDRRVEEAVQATRETRDLVAEVLDLGTQQRRNAETSSIQLSMHLKRPSDAIERKAQVRTEADALIEQGLPPERVIQIVRWMLSCGPVTDSDAEVMRPWIADLSSHPTDQIVLTAMLDATTGDATKALSALDEAIGDAESQGESITLDVEKLTRARRAIANHPSSSGLAPSPRSRR